MKNILKKWSFQSYFFACEQNFYSIKCFNFHFLILISYLVQHFFFWLVRFALFLCSFLRLFSRSFASFSGWFDVQNRFANWFIFLLRLVTLWRLGWGLPCLTAKVTVTVIRTLVIGTCILHLLSGMGWILSAGVIK